PRAVEALWDLVGVATLNAVPYVAAQAGAPEFATAGLLLRGGQSEFTARAAWGWLTGTAADADTARRS
ncbi:hypothetical protein ACWDUG_17240, partial [Streptomyces cellulosae]